MDDRKGSVAELVSEKLIAEVLQGKMVSVSVRKRWKWETPLYFCIFPIWDLIKIIIFPILVKITYTVK